MSGSTWTWIGGTINLDSPSDWTLTAGPGNATGIPETGDTAINNGTLVGYGLIAATLINNGTVEASNNSVPSSSTGGDLAIQGAVSGTGSMIIAPGGTLQIEGPLGAGQSIAFSPGAPETLILGSPTGTISNPITGFALGDALEFAGGFTLNSGPILSGHTLAVSYHNTAGSNSVADLTNVTFAASTPFSFVFGYDQGTGDDYLIPTTFLTWTGASGTNFSAAGNWNLGTVVPSVANYVFFKNGVGGTISGTGTAEGMLVENAGVWSLAPATSLTLTVTLLVGLGGGGATGDGDLVIGSRSTITSPTGGYSVGIFAGDSATLTVSAGGELLTTAAAAPGSQSLYVGSNAASGTLAAASGSVVITGAGSLIDLGFNGLVLGRNGGNGSITVSQGGTLIAATTNSSLNTSMLIGGQGNGTLTVTDPGSQATAIGIVHIAEVEAGTLTVENSGTFLAALDPTGQAGLLVGDGNLSNGEAGGGVGGTGVATVTTDGVLDSQGYVAVGIRGTAGQLTVLNGGTVEVGTTLTVGAGGTIAPGVTETGNGTLTIGAGGTVELTGPAQAGAFGVNIASANDGVVSATNGVVTVSGTGADLNANGNAVGVGELGNGTLTVSAGGTLTAGTPNSNLLDALAIGIQAFGTVAVTDPGSSLTANGAAGIGLAGNGSLVVENSGQVTIGLDGLGTGGVSIGGGESAGTIYAGGTGSVLVTGDGDLLSDTTVAVGQFAGDATLGVSNGGTVEVARSLLIGVASTASAGSTEITSGGTTVLTGATALAGTGTVTIGAGGLLHVDDLGATGVPDITVGNGGTGVLNVSGAGAMLQTTSGMIAIGGSGSGTLELGTGGSVQAGGVSIGNNGTLLFNGGEITLSGTSSNAGEVAGFGTFIGPLLNNGSVVVASGGLLEMAGSLLGSGNVQIGNNASIHLDALASPGQAIVFGSDSELSLNVPGSSFANHITGLNTGDIIEFGGGMTITSASVVNGNTIAVDFHGSSGQAGTYDLTNVGFATGSGEQLNVGVDATTAQSYIQVSTVASGPTLTTLVNFDGTDGNSPWAGLIADTAGDLFSTTYSGGADGKGTVFEVMKTDGTYAGSPTTLASFNGTDGSYLWSVGLIADAAGDLFGTTQQGGANGDGTVFEIADTSTGYSSTPTTLVNFNFASMGASPEAGLIIDSVGNLFGTTGGGGTGNNGTAFELVKTNGTYASTPATLADFNGTNGSVPTASLLEDASGDLFGTTGDGGANGDGTVFEIVKNDGTYASTPITLASFSAATAGFQFVASLISDPAGDLFGTTSTSGTSNDGTVFEIVKANGTYVSTPVILANFSSSIGGRPEGSLLADAAGDLFGTTSNGGTNGDGTVFEIVKSNGSFASLPVTLANFDGTNGSDPIAGLMADSAGDLFSTTAGGGTNGDGTVFEISNSSFVIGPSTWIWTGGTINVDSPSDWTLTAGPGNSTGIPEAGDTAINNGTLVGYGVIAANLINDGTVEASNNSNPGSSTGGDLTVTGAVTGNGVIDIGPGAMVRVDGSIGSGQTVAFNSGTLETLILGAPAATNPFAITGFGAGDRIEFVNGISITSVTEPSSSSLAVNYNLSGGSGSYYFPNVNFAPGMPNSFWIYGDALTGFATVMPINSFTWVGGSGTNYGNGANWNHGGVVPGPLDLVSFNLASGGTISGSGSAYFFSFDKSDAWSLASGTTLVATTAGFNVANNSGATTLTIGTGAAISSGGNIIVGNNVTTFGTLIVSAGGQVSETAITGLPGYAMWIGNASGASGTVTVTGAGSRINLGQNALVLADSAGAMGSLTVSQGGSVSATTLNSSNYYSIAIARLGNGYVTATDPGSQISATGVAFIAHTATGTLTVENSASFVLTPDPTGQAGLVIGSGTTIGVGGTGVANVLTSGELISQGYVDVGLTGTSGQLVVNGGTVQVGTMLTVATGGTIQNGAIETGNGTLTIGAGGTVELTGTAQTSGYGVYLGNSNIGAASTENAVATVSGSGALLNTNGNGIAVAQYGTATLTVSKGGRVVSGTANSNLVAALAIGRQGDGSVTVTDPGSQLTADGSAYLGRAGDGSLTVENQGSVVIGLDGLGNGGLSIGGSGTTSPDILYAGGTGTALVTSGGSLFSAANINVGQNGATGTLSVQSGGTVEAGGRLLIGTAITLAPGATLITPTGTAAVTSTTVENGTGVVTIGAGGVLKVDSDGITTSGTSAVRLGNSAGDTGSIAVSGAGAFLDAGSNWIEIGNAGTGVLTVSQGGSVLAGVISTKDAATVLGDGAGSNGFMTISDPGSTYDAVGQVDVGVYGDGNLTVRNHGTLLSGNNPDSAVLGFTIGWGAGSSGNVTVTGAGSKIVNIGHFEIGGSGNGGNPTGGFASLLIEAGGTVQTSITNTSLTNPAAAIAADPGTDGSSANVTGAGSNWQIGGALLVGEDATGSLAITAGGSVSAASLDAGVQAGSAGIITIAGTGTGLTTTGDVSIGDGGAGELSILNGADVTIGGDLDIGQTAGGSGNVDIEDAGGTVDILGNLNFGAGGPSVLTIGLNTTVLLDNGVVNPGQFASLNLYSPIDPPAVFHFASPTNVFTTQTQIALAYATNSGQVNINPGVTYTVEAPVISGSGGVFQIGTNSAELILNADSVTGQTITFTDDTGKLVIGSDQLRTIDTPPSGSGPFTTGVANPNFGLPLIGGFAGTINNFQAGDQITVETPVAAMFSQNGSMVSVIANGTTLGELTFANVAQAFAAASTNGALDDQVLCFCAGTQIDTPSGEVAVERLAVGDEVLTHRGEVRPITWIGTGRVLATRGRRNAATPVIVRKGALADNVPRRDLHVTKGHSLYFDGVLIPVEFLINHRSILWDDRAQEVETYHIELATHDVLIADGAPAESYRDDGNRWLFQNSNCAWEMPPQQPGAPVLTGGAAVDWVWRRLLDRAGPRPGLKLTEDPDLHLLVDGNRLEPTSRHGGAHVFRLTARPEAVRVVSRAGAPAELGLARDPRVLGVALRRIAVRQGTRFRVMEAADASLAEGFHAFESDNGLRWTDGDAAIPQALLDGFDGPMELVLHVGDMTSYLADYPVQRVA